MLRITKYRTVISTFLMSASLHGADHVVSARSAKRSAPYSSLRESSSSSSEFIDLILEPSMSSSSCSRKTGASFRSQQCLQFSDVAVEAECSNEPSGKRQRVMTSDADQLERIDQLEATLGSFAMIMFQSNDHMQRMQNEIEELRNREIQREEMVEALITVMLTSIGVALKAARIDAIREIAEKNIARLKALKVSSDDYAVQVICIETAERYWHESKCAARSDKAKKVLRNAALEWMGKINVGMVSDRIRPSYEKMRKNLYDETFVDFFLRQSGLI